MFIIKTQMGFVDRFYAAMQIVQITAKPENAKKFKTEKAAQKWANKYANAGYGLTDYSVIAL